MTENSSNQGPGPKRKARDPLTSDPRHVLAAARKAKAEGAGIARALELFRAFDQGKYTEEAGYNNEWFTNRLVYYRQNKEWKEYTPDFSVALNAKQLTSEALAEVLAMERAENGGQLLLPPRSAQAPGPGATEEERRAWENFDKGGAPLTLTPGAIKAQVLGTPNAPADPEVGETPTQQKTVNIQHPKRNDGPKTRGALTAATPPKKANRR